MSTAVQVRSRHAVAGFTIAARTAVVTAHGTLTLHRDTKTSPGSRLDAQGRWSAVPNAFALPSGPTSMGGTCGEVDAAYGLTPACSGCYALNLERAYTALQRMVERNLATVRAAHTAGGTAEVTAVLTAVVERSADLQRRAGVDQPIFRWQSDGDMFARWFAEAIYAAAAATPEVEHWLYTRRPDYVAGLERPRNLAVYLSADVHNFRQVAHACQALDLPWAYLTDNTPADDQALAVLRDAYAVRSVDCPATGKWKTDGRGPAHLVGASGRRADMGTTRFAVGACAACAVCVIGTAPVVFHRHGWITTRDVTDVFLHVRSRK